MTTNYSIDIDPSGQDTAAKRVVDLHFVKKASPGPQM